MGQFFFHTLSGSTGWLRTHPAEPRLASMIEIMHISTMKKAMHLNIKNDEAHKLARELAGLTGESLASAVGLCGSGWHANVDAGAPTRRRKTDEDRKPVCRAGGHETQSRGNPGV
jgi:hypothetical protein